jgi:Fe-Mn family superoxide dismutase
MISNSRRDFMQGLAIAGGTVLLASSASGTEAAPAIDRSSLVQPPLPFAPNALEPVISARTVDIHYNKHHAGYFTNLGKLVIGTDLAKATLEDIILGSAGHADRKALFNNAAQAWNHNLYWQSLSPTPTAPSPALAAAIQRDFGSQDALNAELAKAAISDFGSGWAWLALDSGKLRVVATSNAENPMTAGMVPLLVIDVWEHAYYLDVQNRRADYVNGVIKSLLNWQSASHRLAQAGAGKGA